MALFCGKPELITSSRTLYNNTTVCDNKKDGFERFCLLNLG